MDEATIEIPGLEECDAMTSSTTSTSTPTSTSTSTSTALCVSVLHAEGGRTGEGEGEARGGEREDYDDKNYQKSLQGYPRVKQ